MNRRQFLRSTTTFAVTTSLTPSLVQAEARQKPTPAQLPRWRGFNLTEKYVKHREKNPPYRKTDFEMMSEWGFDFARLPLSYLCWTEPGDWLKIREAELAELDDAIEFGRKHGVHINLNLHRAPGYCVNPPKEALDLWTDQKALGACAFHWGSACKTLQGHPQRPA
jgi:endoglucanase